MKRPAFALLITSSIASIVLTACGGGLPDAPTPTSSAPAPTATSQAQPAGTGSTIGTGSTGSTGATGTTGAEATPPPATGGGGGLTQSRYTVVAGDAPSIIAEKLGVPVDDREDWIAEMLAINDVTATNIQIGQELILPPVNN